MYYNFHAPFFFWGVGGGVFVEKKGKQEKVKCQSTKKSKGHKEAATTTSNSNGNLLVEQVR